MIIKDGQKKSFDLRKILFVSISIILGILLVLGSIYFFSGKGASIPNAETKSSFILPPFVSKSLNLVVNKNGLRKLTNKRDEAIERGVLRAADDDWVPCKLEDGTETLEAKTRLKGDWVDHLQGGKWSFRVKFKKDHTWNRMKTLSFHTPSARSGLSEWVLHQFWEYVDVLTTRYDFVRLEFNGVSRGIYAYEEHFEKQLLEFRNRREGPIVRFSETAIWDLRDRATQNYGHVPGGLDLNHDFNEAEIGAFGEKRVLKSPALSKQYEEARNLMFQYQQGLKKASDIFDIDQVAKYYAVCDLMNSYHGNIWHNQRFYYNPVINKLEPIGFDGNVGVMDFKVDFLGQRYMNPPKDDISMDVFANLSSDPVFSARYIYFLDKFSQKDYIEEFIKKIEIGAIAREDFLKEEFKKTKFEADALRKKAKKIQTLLFPFNDDSIIPSLEKGSGDERLVRIQNKHWMPLEIVGTGISKDKMNFKLEESVLVWKDTHSGRKKYENPRLDIPLKAEYIFFKPLGIDTIFFSKVRPYLPPQNKSASQDIFSGVSLKNTAYYSLEEKQVKFRQGKHVIDKNIVIPSGYQVKFQAGTELDFIKKAGFISQSPVRMVGTSENPIIIQSSDNSAKGFSVLQAKDTSIVQGVIFSNFNTLQHGNWNLTGAVTFYESNVKIKQSIITNNHCEDALNIIRSHFEIKNIIISETFSDGFDADFCTGNISNSQFKQTGNDGMDFSGSQIKITNTSVNYPGDKGLSVGEESHVSAKGLEIKNAVLGVASKDLSVLNIDDIILENCEQGFAAYRKKPEYGGGNIHVKSYQAEKVKSLYQIEKGSKLILVDKTILE